MILQADSRFHTGDINFFAACMSIGIPPKGPRPAEVVHSTDGHTYLTFNLEDISECGTHQTAIVNAAWSQPHAFKREFPNHPFVTLMDFAREARLRNAKDKTDWVDVAAEFLGVPRAAVSKAIRDISALEVSAPESPLAYIACFIENRFAAASWAKSAIPKEHITHGKSVVLMDSKLAKKHRANLIARL